MAQGGIKHAPLAEVLAPGDGIITRSLLIGMLVESQQTMHLRALKSFEQVNLIEDFPIGRQMAAGGTVLILVNDIDLHLSVMLLELSAQHVQIRLKMMESIAGGMHANETFAGL